MSYKLKSGEITEQDLTDKIDWQKDTSFYRWKSNVFKSVRAVWPILTREQRLAIAEEADDKAGHEWEKRMGDDA